MEYFEDDSTYKSFNIKPWLKLGRFFKPYSKKIISIIIFMLITAAMDLSLPLFQKYAVDTFIVPKTTEGIEKFIIVYTLALITMTVSVNIFARLAIIVEMHIGKDLRRDIFVHLQNLSLSYYNRNVYA